MEKISCCIYSVIVPSKKLFLFRRETEGLALIDLDSSFLCSSKVTCTDLTHPVKSFSILAH